MGNNALTNLNTKAGETITLLTLLSGSAVGVATIGAGIVKNLLGLSKIPLGKIELIAVAVAAVVTAIIKLKEAYDNTPKSAADFTQAIEDSNKQLEENQKRLEEINKLKWYEKTPEILDEKAAIEAENEELRKNIELLAAKGAKKAAKSYASQEVAQGYTVEWQDWSPYNKGITDVPLKVIETYDTLGDAMARINALQTEVSMSSPMLTTEFLSGDEAVNYLIDSLTVYNEKLVDNKELTTNELAEYEKLKDTLLEYRSYMVAMTSAYNLGLEGGHNYAEEIQHIDNILGQSETAFEGAKNKVQDFVQGLIDVYSQEVKTEEEMYALVRSMIAVNSQGLNFDEQIEALRTLAIQAGLASSAIESVFNAAEINKQISYLTAYGGLSEKEAKERVYESTWNTALRLSTPTTTTTDDTTYGGTGGSSTDTWKQAAEKEKSILKAKYEANLITYQDYVNGLIAIDKAYYEGREKYEEEHYEMLADIYELQDDYLKDLVDSYITALENQEEIEEKALEIEEKKAEVLKKQNDLLKAQSERSVRVYNAATGQWEWVANASNVESAKTALATAQKALTEATTIKASEVLKTATSGGITYRNVTASGNAPMGTQIGDVVHTSDGDYLVVPAGTAGAHQGNTGLWSIRIGSGEGLSGYSSNINKVASTLSGAGTSVGTQYVIEGVTLSESQARSTTVYDISQSARTLAVKNKV